MANASLKAVRARHCQSGRQRLGAGGIQMKEGDGVFITTWKPARLSESGVARCGRRDIAHQFSRARHRPCEGERMKTGRNEIQELHAKEVGVGNPSEERASS